MSKSEKAKKDIIAARYGKRLAAIKSSFDITKQYKISEALEFVKANSKVKFDETIDIVVKLGVDPKHADQMVRGMVALPNGTGKNVKVAVFAKAAKAEEAKQAGADIVGDEDLVANILAGKIEFDRCIATPDMMPVIAKVAKILGPKGLMPNPKLGTVTINVAEAVKNVKAGQIEFRVEKAGIIHAGIGKVSFGVSQLEENVKAFINALLKAKPAGAKGSYMKTIFIGSTMGSSLKVDLASITGA